ncbi:MAG TPA: acyl-[ACP]--phospholipid O-acyltransferase [Acetobacteraceae bacterium]|jgi:acyl-[acyl-carrier-protein]-phospholipid O-acyltransferase/long-chain-fatty-acid--[acyl-carrier-protein] ligase
MSVTPLGLLRTRRLWPLALAQSCGALNDNLVKNAMVVLAIFQLRIGGAGLSALAGALFIAPYILLSATAGQLADRYPKPRVILACKAAEVVLMLASAAAFLTESVPALLAILAGLGVQAALFGPVKYGVLPEHLAEDELVAGNGVIEATTFLAIVAGTVAGGALILFRHGTVLVGATGVALSLLGLAAAACVPPVPAADPSLRISPNVFSDTWRVMRHAATIRPIWLSVLGLSWFWTMGATLITEFPIVARDTLRGGGSVLTLLLTVFAVGVGAGSIQCARLLHGEVSARLVPFAALGISLFCWDFASAAHSAGDIATAAVALSTWSGWRMDADLFLVAACGGMFSVPLYAIIQDTAAPFERSRMVAANNIMNALFMVAGAAATAALAAAGLRAPAVLHLAAIANLLVAVWIVRMLPREMYAAVLRWYFRTFHGVQVHGLDNYRAARGRVVIVANHQSYLDAPLLAAFLPGDVTFAIHTGQAAKWYFRPFLAMVETFPVDVQSPYAVKRMVEAVRDRDRRLMIFPEGRMTHTGSLMKVYEGAAMVADKSHARIVPICIDGLQFSRFNRMRGRLRQRWFPRVTLRILPPVTLAPPDATLTPRQRRELTGRALQDAMVAAVFSGKDPARSLFSAVLDARALHGGRTLIVEDTGRAPISYDRVVLGSVVLGRALRDATAGETHVALMLPNAIATIVSFLGLQAFGVVPCLLNVSAGAANMLAACRVAGARTVVSSRTFVEKGRLAAVAERMAAEVRFIWLEDLRTTLGTRAKLHGLRDRWRARRLPGAFVDPDAPAVVLYTSGSEGTPKGVALSHRNILANCAQVASVIDFNGGDIAFNAMPVFHAFGLTGGTILPLVSGVRTFHYPTPLHYRIVPALIYDTDATITFGTDTFLRGWGRYANPYDFHAMRYIFGGAEKVQEDTRRLFSDRFGARIMEGYGVTETSPVLTLNTAMHARPGTTGRFLPGIEWRLQPVAGIDAGGRLLVRGPNVMLGYLHDTAPGVVEPLTDGWYDTGDIVSVDAAGFMTIVGRVKRFAKIGGEMVSMEAAEALALALWPDARHAVIGLPDARKGEALLLVTTHKGAEMRALLGFARQRGIAELMVPRAVLTVASVPLLATGKVDYPAVTRLVEESQAVPQTATA